MDAEAYETQWDRFHRVKFGACYVGFDQPLCVRPRSLVLRPRRRARAHAE